MAPRKHQPALTQADLDALHALVADAKAAELAAAKRRGREQVYRWLGHAVWAVAAILLTWWLNHRGVQRNDETRHMHTQETARVEEKLKQVEDVTKALAPGAFSSRMTAK